MSTERMTVLTSSAHVWAVATRFDLNVTMEGNHIECRREVPGLGTLAYRATVRDRVIA